MSHMKSITPYFPTPPNKFQLNWFSFFSAFFSIILNYAMFVISIIQPQDYHIWYMHCPIHNTHKETILASKIRNAGEQSV